MAADAIRLVFNFGYCFPYALAKSRGDMFAFSKAKDFSKTDLIPAWQP